MGKNKRNNKQHQHKHSQHNVATASVSSTSQDPNQPTVSSNNQTNNNSNSNNCLYGTLGLPTIKPKDRKALNQLALSLLELVDTPPANANEEWKQYVEMHRLLNQMMQHELALSRVVCPPDNDKAAAASEEVRLAKVAAFGEWARSGGVQSDCVEIATFPGYQLGLRATRDIAAEEQVLSVPRKLIFSEENLYELERPVFSSFPIMTNINLACALVIEKVRGADSPWKPYIDILPSRYNTILYFTVEQMQRLRGTSACTDALEQCRAIARQYASMYKWAFIRRDSVLAAMSILFTQYGLCYELYRWAVSTVMTRQNRIPREVNSLTTNVPLSALIPYWDMANHRSGKITSFYDGATNQMDCTAQEACKAGEQFFIYYGNRSNAELLVHNGFLDANNQKDYVQIRLSLSPTDVLGEQRSRLLTKLNIERKAELRVLPAPEYISGELLAFVRVFNMSKDQLDHWCSDLERAADLLHIDCALDTDLEARTWQYLYQRLKLLLGVLEAMMHDTDELEMLAKLQLNRPESVKKDEVNVNHEIDTMLLQYRRLERRILNDALQYAQERLKV